MEKILFLDTNIFLRFFFRDEVNPHLSLQADKIFQDLENEKYHAFVTELVLAEVIFVLTSFYKKTKEEIFDSIFPLCNVSSLIIQNKEQFLSALFLFKEANVDFTDAHTVVSMRALGIEEILTFDHNHFKRFEGITISKKTRLG